MAIGCVGVPGSGKTTILRRLVLDQARRGGALRIYDSRRSFVGHVYESVRGFQSAKTQMKGTPRVAVFRSSAPPYTKEAAAAVLDVMQLVHEEGGTLVLDEIADCVHPRRDVPAPFARVAFQGRMVPQAGIMWGAQSLQLVHPRIRDVTKIWYVGRQTSRVNREILRDEIDPRLFDLAPRLRDLEYVEVRLLGGDPPPVLVVETIEPTAADFVGRERG